MATEQNIKIIEVKHTSRAILYPRHGRLVQAKFNKSGVLMVRAAPIYSFVRNNQGPWNLFLRYHAREPRDGPKIEFGDDEECIPAGACAPKHAPNLPEFEKENAPPKEGETPSVGDL
ncbi:hypothetical protein N7447_000685 [Penicillium robsamsonii]|uniref:uncharacterized protein n=1 Tax=Penicillium robsamsonii TaxID=1792511 RepID=UPI0025471779|nr:uncharacterized protein N7447_000685 [Penicillium robsamsonii]KAJ5834659.1 hypothetical protein N7447_000685 [Penicillium robsamsonii]